MVNAVTDERPILVFTDGSWEGGIAGLGAVVIDVASQQTFVFSGQLPESLLAKWGTMVGEHLICQIELYAMVAIRWHFQQVMTNRRVIWWTDNEAARYSVIKCDSSSPSMKSLIREFYAFEVDSPSYGWIERVPSYSNIAGSPSRFSPQEACDILGLSSWSSFPNPEELIDKLAKAGP